MSTTPTKKGSSCIINCGGLCIMMLLCLMLVGLAFHLHREAPEPREGDR